MFSLSQWAAKPFLLLLVVMIAFAKAFLKNYKLWQDLKEISEISVMEKMSENSIKESLFQF